MRWYEYKMEVDDLAAPDDLKAKLLAMTDTLTAEEKAEPMMAAPAPQTAAPAAPLNTETKKKKPIHFPVKQLGTLAACLAVCVLGYSTLHLGIGMGSAKSSAPALYAAEGAADSSAASVAAGGFDLQHAALDSTPEAVNYSLDADDRSLETEYSGTGSTEAAAPAVDSAKIIYTANLTLESKDYEAARSALDSALAEAGGYLESSSEYTRPGSSRSVNLTYRVPQANYQSFLEAVAAAGNVTYRSQQADDVTTQYMDVSARLSNLQAQRTRLQQLQAQAARHAQGRGQPPGEMPAARGGLCAVIFYGGGVVRVRRTGRILQPGIVRRVGVAVGQHGRQRRAAGQAVRKAAQEFRAVRLAAGARQGAAPRRAPVQKGLQGRKIGPEARREAVEAHAHGRAVRFTKKL